jgi:hypothetical protein
MSVPLSKSSHPQDPEDSAGRLFNWLHVNGARLIEKDQYLFNPLRFLIVYELWQMPNGKYMVLEQRFDGTPGRPPEHKFEVDSISEYCRC